MDNAGYRLTAINQVFDFFEFFKLVCAVKAGSTVLVRWAKIVPPFPSSQALDGNAGEGGNAANAVKVVC